MTKEEFERRWPGLEITEETWNAGQDRGVAVSFNDDRGELIWRCGADSYTALSWALGRVRQALTRGAGDGETGQ